MTIPYDTLAIVAEAVVELDEPPVCPACESAYGALLGVLGSREWYRCVGCGIDFSRARLVYEVDGGGCAQARPGRVA